MSKHEKDTGNGWDLINWIKYIYLTSIQTLIIIITAFVCFYFLIAIAHFLYQLSLLAFDYTGSDFQKFNTEQFASTRLLILLLTTIIGLPFLIWRTFLADKQTKNAEKQTAVAQEKVSIDEQTHYTTLYTRAIELLGATHQTQNPKLTVPTREIRIGAIYALERIAHDSPKDHWPIMEVLTAYIRKNSAVKLGLNDVINAYQEIAEEDIKAIITVIGRRNKKHIKEEKKKGYKLDLSYCNLNGIRISEGADFSNVNFHRSFISAKGTLLNVNFQNCQMDNTRILDTNFIECDFSGASICISFLENTKFHKCHFWDSNLCEDSRVKTTMLILPKIFHSSNLVGSNYIDVRIAQSITQSLCDMEQIEFYQTEDQNTFVARSDFKKEFSKKLFMDTRKNWSSYVFSHTLNNAGYTGKIIQHKKQ